MRGFQPEEQSRSRSRSPTAAEGHTYLTIDHDSQRKKPQTSIESGKMNLSGAFPDKQPAPTQEQENERIEELLQRIRHLEELNEQLL